MRLSPNFQTDMVSMILNGFGYNGAHPMHRLILNSLLTLLLLPSAFGWAQQDASRYPQQFEGDWSVPNFTFKSGETLPQLRLHYITLGSPARDAAGHVTNAVLVLHGTGGTG